MTPDLFEDRFNALVANVERVIRGKGDEVRLVLVALVANGHVLLEDMPGTGKTMLARAIAQSIDGTTSRVQCTPDLLPSDIAGSPIFDQRTNEFSFRRGPVFANILLVDEVNRATPKTQSALLEAMQERRVTVDGVTRALPNPFLVLATQNPLELAGTFPLPEAQLDRFLVKLTPGYPDRAAEISVLRTNKTQEVIDDLEPVVDTAAILELMDWANGVHVPAPVEALIVDLCQGTRGDPALMLGASTRAALALMRAGRVLAASQGREDVYPDDVITLVKPVLGHRLVLTPEAGLRSDSVDAAIDRLLARTRVPMGLVG